MADYPWKRFWCLRDGRFQSDRDGFLLDPQEEFGSIINAEAKPIEALAGSHVLGLLGEAGSGKTQTLKAEHSNLAGQIEQAGGIPKFISLRDIGSSADLDREIFDSDWFRVWRTGGSELHLFLDALDEASHFYPQIPFRLLNRLSDLPLQRLFVRMTCRTALWPTTFDTELRQLLNNSDLGAQPYAVYELLPLRRVDVALAATIESIAPAHFLEEVVRKGLVPLASKPMTLRFLIRSYRDKGVLPSSSVGAYADGCRDLASDTNDARRDGRATGELDVSVRLAIAQRIAAVTLLANRQAVWMGVPSEQPAGDASLDDARGVEPLDGEMLRVTGSEIKEVLNTGLFSARGETRLGWAHQTFGEFLAARYLESHRLTTSQILSLITTPDDPAQRVRPQLTGTAAWLGSMREDVQTALLERDPAVLLLGDSTTLGPEFRPRLVAALLKRFESAELHDREGALSRSYGKLSHPGIADQLREAVTAPELSLVTKREAIAIARACELTELSNSLAELALDATASIELRSAAASTVASIGDPASRSRLIPLIEGAPEDADDQLKGAALAAVWPRVVETRKVLPCLTRQKSPHYFGPYWFFLYRLPEEVPDADIPALLRWISNLDEGFKGSITFGKLASRIVERAWSLADEREVMEALAGALQNMSQLYLEGSKANWQEPIQRRRFLIDHLVQAFDGREAARAGWPWNLGVPTADDFEWMLMRFREASEKQGPVWLELLVQTFQPGDARQSPVLIENAHLSQSLAAEFEAWLGSVELNSESAREARKVWRERDEREKDRASHRRDGKAELERLLDSIERGELQAWCWVPQALAIGPDGRQQELFASIDLVTQPGWSGADPSTRERILKAAERFLKESDPETKSWLGTNRITIGVHTGIAALSVLSSQSAGRLLGLSTQTWQQWAPALVSFPFFGGTNLTAAPLRKEAYSKAPREVLDTLATLIDAEDKEGGSTWATEHVDDFWDDRVANLFLSRVRHADLKEGTFSRLFGKLMEHRNEEATRVARDLIAQPLPADPAERQRFISVGVMLLAADPMGTWPLVLGLFGDNESFARDFVSALARSTRPEHANLFESLTEPLAADLYVRLSHLFPHANDRLVNGVVTPDDEGRMLRNSLLTWLQNRGTPEACLAIESIARRLPDLPWLKRVLQEANQAKRRNTPNWPEPEDVLKLAADRSRRLVRDATDLLDVVVEVLTKLETELQGETPAAEDLWDGNRPKPEEPISDYVKRYLDRELRERGVIANREVRIHIRERTDIHVDAIAESDERTRDVVTVIIETKGCWNAKLLTALQDQLVSQYLTNNQCHHGLYLVFWFECDAWDPKDTRRKRRPWRGTVDELRAVLAAQAENLGGFSVRTLVLDARLKR